mgnify:CR=1 FL=1
MGKTHRKDSDKFGRDREKTFSKRVSVRYDQYDPEEDQGDNYERIRPKTRPTVSKQTKKDS